MNWSNLTKGLCPKCDTEFKGAARVIHCSNIECDFQIRQSKYIDLAKGKESNAYKNAIKNYQNLKKRAKISKDKQKQSIQTIKSEKLYNIGKLFRQGIISKKEHDDKIKLMMN